MTKTSRLSTEHSDAKKDRKDRKATPVSNERVHLASSGQGRHGKRSASISFVTGRKGIGNNTGCIDADIRLDPDIESLEACDPKPTLLEDFASSVTAIGLSHLANRQAKASRRLFWLVVFTAALTFTAYHVTQRVSAYLATPVTVKVSLKVGIYANRAFFPSSFIHLFIHSFPTSDLPHGNVAQRTSTCSSH